MTNLEKNELKKITGERIIGTSGLEFFTFNQLKLLLQKKLLKKIKKNKNQLKLPFLKKMTKEKENFKLSSINK